MNMLSEAEKIRKEQARRCKKCEETTGKKDIDECFECPFHISTNQAYRLALRGSA